jgi:putative flippase GtrA
MNVVSSPAAQPARPFARLASELCRFGAVGVVGFVVDSAVT